jgi:stage III sporulation protein AD
MAVIILVFTLTGERVREAVGMLVKIAEGRSWSAVGKVMLKALGITAVSRITSDICIQAGENALAGQVETAGAVEIVLLSLPLAVEILDVAGSLLP